MHKQLWAAELNRNELDAILDITHKELEVAIKSYIKALKKETITLRHKLEQGLRVSDLNDDEGIKGYICAKVMERWSFEKRVEEMGR